MARKRRIAVVGALSVTMVFVAILGIAYYAARQVRPFYEQALRIEPQAMERNSRELESRASALYSDAKKLGQWRALFTAQQINSWLATQQAANKNGELLANIRDVRVAVARDCLTIGFQTKWSGVESVLSIDASLLLTDDGAVGVRFLSAHAGELPLPVMQVAGYLASLSKKRNLPVRWTQEKSQPIAIIRVESNPSSEDRQFFIDSVELRDGELYVAGHTAAGTRIGNQPTKLAYAHRAKGDQVPLDDYELRLTPENEKSALEIARRHPDDASASEAPAKR